MNKVNLHMASIDCALFAQKWGGCCRRPRM